ncbi:MAG: hypothetical protein IV107_09250 [Paucibacter sp.]|jgi:hypothetical protein|nr:hypothetical protein [Roseateles sp.]
MTAGASLQIVQSGKTFSMHAPRLFLPILASAAALMSGCATPHASPVVPEGSYCQTVMKPRRQVCITGVTSAYLAKGVAELAGSANAFTVYVVRNNWADPTELADVRSTGTPVVQTLPQTFARFRLPPGQHELTVSWRSGATRTVVSGAAGEVKYLRVKGWAFWTLRDFSFWQIDRNDAVELTQDGKFIGDVESNP